MLALLTLDIYGGSSSSVHQLLVSSTSRKSRGLALCAMKRPLPFLTSLNRFFWESGREGRLQFLRCQECTTWVHPPQPVCPACLDERLAPTAVVGSGVIDSFTVNHQAWAKDMEVPFVIARVQLDDAQIGRAHV